MPFWQCAASRRGRALIGAVARGRGRALIGAVARGRGRALIGAVARGRLSHAVGVLVVLLIGLGVDRAHAEGQAGDDETEREEVVIEGSRALLPSSPSSKTAASTVLEAEALHGAGTTTADVLSRVPGVQVARRGAQSDLATASIRGSGSGQVPIYIAGIRINDDVSGTADLSTVPLWMMERAEIFRGNAPQEADRLGIGGAIFFTPRVPRDTRAGVGATLGSYGHKEGWLAAEVAAPRGGALIAVRRAGAKNNFPYVNDHGQRFDLNETEERRQNADFTDSEVWAIGRTHLAPGAHVTTVMQALNREQGVTGVAVQPASQARASVRRILLGVSSRLPCRSGSDSCVVHLGTSLLVAQLRLENPLLELPAARSPLLQNNGERATQTARLVIRVHERAQLSAGVAASVENLRMNRAEHGSPRATRASVRPSLQFDWDVAAPFSAHLLVAGECHTTDGVGDRYGEQVVQQSGACGVLEPVGRVGFSYAVFPQWTLLANVGRSVRVPTLGELYGTSALVSGNVELAPETGWSADFGTRGEWASRGKTKARFALDAFGFSRWVDDLIRYRRSSLKAVTPFNVASARYLGVELAAALSLFSFLRADTTATLLDARETTPDATLDPTKNDVLPLTARLVLTQSLSLSSKGIGAIRQDRAELLLRYQLRSSRFADSAGQVVLPAQSFVDLEATSSFFEERVLVRLSVRNLLNQHSSDILGLPLPGRTFFGGAELWF